MQGPQGGCRGIVGDDRGAGGAAGGEGGGAGGGGGGERGGPAPGGAAPPARVSPGWARAASLTPLCCAWAVQGIEAEESSAELRAAKAAAEQALETVEEQARLSAEQAKVGAEALERAEAELAAAATASTGELEAQRQAVEAAEGRARCVLFFVS